MIDSVYQILADFGYHHPLHPVLVHLTIGMVLGTFIFGFLAWIAQSVNMTQTARHCSGLALISVIPTAAMGYGDWQHFFAGAWILPIRWKLILSMALFVILFIAWLSARKSEKATFGNVLIYFICVGIVTVIGYFGAEMVHGKKMISKGEPLNELVVKGGEIFDRSCSVCHFTETEDTRIGPGLKGLFQKNYFPVSQWPTTRENFKKQLRTPYKNMPPFDSLEDEQIEALIAYMETL